MKLIEGKCRGVSGTDVTRIVLGDLTSVDGNDKVDMAATSDDLAKEVEVRMDLGAPMRGNKNGGEGMIEKS